MGFQKGKPKTGGRKQGTPNKSSIAKFEILKAATEDFNSKLREHQIDPIAGIAGMLPMLEPMEYCQVMLALCRHKYPTMKPADPKKLDNPYAGLTPVELLKNLKIAVSALEDQVAEEAAQQPALPARRGEDDVE